jgi:lipoprotein-anchoring transpeptidase ErfK/SrfK
MHQRNERTRQMHRISVMLACAALLAGVLCPLPAAAHRFGPPWQSRVVADSTIVYSQPDAAAAPVGPLEKGQIVVVLNEVTPEWTQIPVGFVRSSDIAEEFLPWIAEVTLPSISIYARPNTREPIRRTARQGDLLRVAGVSPGIDGDTSTWWATTEGYVRLDGLREATSDWARNWTVPQADLAPLGWWGAVRAQANVRAAATTQAPVVGGFAAGDRVKVLEEVEGDAVGGNLTWYRVDGGRYAGALVHSSLIGRIAEPRPVVAEAPEMESPTPWIAVSRKTATLTYFEADGTPKFTTYVSLGRAGVETPAGDYSTMGKYRYDTMSSASVADADHAYHLPNVPSVEYYRDGGYAIHGTYWHDHFGGVESQGCINLTWADSAYLFGLTQPTVAPEDLARWAINLPATPLRILE